MLLYHTTSCQSPVLNENALCANVPCIDVDIELQVSLVTSAGPILRTMIRQLVTAVLVTGTALLTLSGQMVMTLAPQCAIFLAPWM